MASPVVWSVSNSSSSGCSITTGDTSWVLISSVLVLGMSPALAFFEAGMLRSKNTLSLVSQIFSGVIALSALWMVIGYSLTFGPSQAGLIGDPSAHVLFVSLPYDDCSPHAPHVPAAVFALFQMMFAVITPLLITGAYAERMKFKAYFIFTLLWEILVYFPIAHSVWGGGLLARLGALDFAGGIVIHTTAGTASLVSAIIIGRRTNFFDYYGEFPPSSLPLAAIGAALLWIGWMGFNGGSALSAGSVAVSAVVSTQIGCSFSALVWLLLSWYRDKPSTTALMNGALAGLAGITPASGYIDSQVSIILGIILGLSAYGGVYLLKHKFHIDDALEVSMVHGLTGAIGSLWLGIFSQKALNPEGGADGWWYGNPKLLGYQIVAVLVTIVYTAIITWGLLKFIDRFCGGLRATEDNEKVGMDWSEHQEIAYHRLHVLDDPDLAEAADHEPQHNGLAIASPYVGLHDGNINNSGDRRNNENAAALNSPLLNASEGGLAPPSRPINNRQQIQPSNDPSSPSLSRNRPALPKNTDYKLHRPASPHPHGSSPHSPSIPHH